ncbi:hypothetical protein DPMN_164739 [Dreissena polymorpha]|uniref:Uncharacterized protein n=1 Tax=Dreissena polymorpha TaxID=45954 RepID=A0A9D4EZA9_DREPO|nr:hypothetical protein DPMN_164739 [Dreissena polymorpha]
MFPRTRWSCAPHTEESSEKFLFKCLYPALCVRSKRRGIAAVEKDGDYEGHTWCLYVVGKLMEMLVRNLLSLAIAAVAMAVLIRTSAVLVSYLDRVAPQYFEAGHFF